MHGSDIQFVQWRRFRPARFTEANTNALPDCSGRRLALDAEARRWAYSDAGQRARHRRRRRRPAPLRQGWQAEARSRAAAPLSHAHRPPLRHRPRRRREPAGMPRSLEAARRRNCRHRHGVDRCNASRGCGRRGPCRRVSFLCQLRRRTQREHLLQGESGLANPPAPRYPGRPGGSSCIAPSLSSRSRLRLDS